MLLEIRLLKIAKDRLNKIKLCKKQHYNNDKEKAATARQRFWRQKQRKQRAHLPGLEYWTEDTVRQWVWVVGVYGAEHDSEGRGCLIGGDYGGRGGHLKQLAKQWFKTLFKYEIKKANPTLAHFCKSFTCKFRKCTKCSIQTWIFQTLFTKVRILKQ